jgi:hypothetical protein
VWSFAKPVAHVYVSEVRRKMDPLVVPIFTPDTAIDVGDFGSFEDGRFDRRGNLAERGVDLSVVERPHAGFEFASAGKVSIGPSVTVPHPGGGDLVEATLTFTRGRAVVASFPKGVERAVADADRFAEELARLWASRELKTDRSVVWAVRRATGGTIIVSKEGGHEVKLVASSALLGPAGITLGNLSAGVEFAGAHEAVWKQSSSDQPLVIWARIFRLDEQTREAVDAFGFEPGADLDAHVQSIRPASMSPDDLLAQLDPA